MVALVGAVSEQGCGGEAGCGGETGRVARRQETRGAETGRVAAARSGVAARAGVWQREGAGRVPAARKKFEDGRDSGRTLGGCGLLGCEVAVAALRGWMAG